MQVMEARSGSFFCCCALYDLRRDLSLRPYFEFQLGELADESWDLSASASSARGLPLWLRYQSMGKVELIFSKS